MLAIQAQYDGQNIRIPEKWKKLPPGDVIIVFEEQRSGADRAWLQVQEEALATAWDDEEDAVYDQV